MPASFVLEELNLAKESEYHRLLTRCPGIELKRFDDGEYLMREGHPSQEVFVVASGAYVVEQKAGEEHDSPAGAVAAVISDPATPSFVGEMAYLGKGARTASVRSSGATFAMVLKPMHLDVIIAEFPLLTRILCRQFTGRLHETNALLRTYQQQHAMGAATGTKEPGAVLFVPGEPADTLHQLVDGVLLRETATGVEQLTPARPWQGFVEPAPFFRHGVRESRVTTKTRVLLVTVSRDAILAVVRSYPELLLGLYSAAIAATGRPHPDARTPG